MVRCRLDAKVAANQLLLGKNERHVEREGIPARRSAGGIARPNAPQGRLVYMMPASNLRFPRIQSGTTCTVVSTFSHSGSYFLHRQNRTASAVNPCLT